ncbi:related to pH-response regulator protein palH/RIM21 [Phialocephala subalpina]|uniref:Related to pH-response regulator protein palH/RIM21 n=1 Tax=Phialocephala subalpina TaxID=576137 RepID=A0A1L7WWK2_9HELO|nr:related to pH-response regulator protein palH/RIM21 [Phialocephala subalpina]
MEARQIINIARPTKTSTITSRPHCTPFSLPSNGLLTLGVSQVITLTSDAVFRPECTGSSDIILTGSSSPSYLDLRDPFYASTIPECYALAAATVIAYMLVIMLLITPRTFLHEGAVVLGRRGFTNGPSGSDAGIGIGGRPWLQKVAALTVAISLTIATADTFKVAEQQYEIGYMDAQALQNQVEDGTELKVIRVISDTFLWLAQAQTLIRLFPRQREKIIIKWTAFALITLDVLFSILNNFVYDGNSRPRSFVDAVPALAYLFQLALSLLYAAWVIYYSITKKRFAYYHPQMKNICLVALLSLVAVLVPVVFFVLDISKPDLAGWGDYVRWVGAAAASVVVWEWVERIEALERDDKKDGVLGREVFDGDEMLEVGPSSESTWKYRLKRDDSKKGGKSDGGVTTGSHGRHWPAMSGLANRYRPRATHDVETGTQGGVRALKPLASRKPRPKPPLWPTRPPPAATPVSRTDTASAESTVYAIRYHPISEVTPPIRGNERPPGPSRANSLEIVVARSEHEDAEEQLEKKISIQETEEDRPDFEPAPDRSNTWQTLTRVNPFRRRAQDPPPEVSAHTVKPPEPINAHGSSNKWDIAGRLEDFVSTKVENFKEKKRPTVTEADLPRTIIPAPPRRRNLTATLEELEQTERGERPITGSSNTFVATPNTLLSRPPISESPENSRSPQPHRLSDPYTPSDLNSHSIHQRGAISFATADPQDRETNELVSSPVSPVSAYGRDIPTVISSRENNSQPLSPVSPRRDGLPFVSIPAPPRRPRSNDE